MKKLLILLGLLSSSAYAAPTVNTITGTIQDGGTVTVPGSGFGTKSPAAPALWAPFSSSVSPVTGAWGTIENMAWDSDEGYNGTGGMKGTAGSGIWTMYLPNGSLDPYNEEGTNTYTFHHEKMNFIVQGTGNNFKTFRIWPNSGAVSNLYFSSSHGRIFVENIGGSTDAGYFKNCNPNTTAWVTKERFITPSSASGVKDGRTTERFNGVEKHTGNIISRSASAPSDWTKMVVVQGVLANKGSWSPAWSTSNNLWADNVYVDRTFQRVMIGDKATFAECRKLGLVIPTSWSNTSISGTMFAPTNDFPPGSTAYVYVFDATNTPNTAGRAITIGGSVVGDPAPTVTAVNPSTGTFNGTTTATATGTGFLSGLTIRVGTMTASNIVLNSATSARFTIPAYIPGSTGLDLTVENSDGQFGVLPSTISYTSPAANQPPFDVNAGDDWFLTMPAQTILSGFAEDDGLPSGTLTYLWQKKSGPGTVTFVDATAITTTAAFSQAGTYTISLTASDGSLSTESPEVQVVVEAPIGLKFPFKRR